MDTITRAMATKLGDLWKQPVTVDNRPGGNEIIGALAVAKAPNDGYTLILVSDATLSLNPLLYTKLPYDPVKEFTPIGRVAVSNMAFVVPASMPVKTFQEFVAYAKANPGKVPYASTGLGNSTHLAMEWLAHEANVNMLHVPYKGLAPIITDLMGSQVQAAFGSVSVLAPYVETGKLKALAISGPKRAAAMPNVPTFKELGYPDFEASYYMAILAPGGLAQDIRNKISTDIRAVTADPAFRKTYMDAFALDAVNESPEQFSAFLRQERAIVEKKVKLSGVKLD
ncbi:MAG: tripartite tricarboxylate transporter substrate binding protein [Burkholderiaceae bacterium]|nr:tripartite tricarboxylate transporter substrate binding protein [Burkholderiaceae bacterium]